MATPSKRYYWLKLKEDFFRDKVMKKLRKIAGGDTYVIIYLKMMLLSITSDGCLFYDGVEQDFSSELALDLDEDKENVQVTVAFLMRNGKLIQKSDTEFYMPDAYNAIGSETKAAERVRKHRLNKQASEQEALQCNVNVTLCNTEIDREIEKELEIETDKDNLSFFLERCEDFSTSQQSSNKPMLKEVEAYAEAENIQTDIQRFYSYYEKTGWKTKSGQPITDWKSTLRYWADTDKKDADTSKKKPEAFEAENAAAYRSLIYNLDE